MKAAVQTVAILATTRDGVRFFRPSASFPIYTSKKYQRKKLARPRAAQRNTRRPFRDGFLAAQSHTTSGVTRATLRHLATRLEEKNPAHVTSGVNALV